MVILVKLLNRTREGRWGGGGGGEQGRNINFGEFARFVYTFSSTENNPESFVCVGFIFLLLVLHLSQRDEILY